jgi:hypothetical protein
MSDCVCAHAYACLCARTHLSTLTRFLGLLLSLLLELANLRLHVCGGGARA